jgi:hypothetical protein
MGMTVVATFINLPEARVAASALESGGLHPLVMDQGRGSVVWTEQAALQGFRLAVPSDEATDAVAFFRALPPPRRRPRPASRSAAAVVGSNWWRVVGGLLAIGLMPELGWLVVGLRPKLYRRSSPALFVGILAAVAAVVIVAALFFVAIQLLAGVPLSVWIVSPLVVAILVVALVDRRKSPPKI